MKFRVTSYAQSGARDLLLATQIGFEDSLGREDRHKVCSSRTLHLLRQSGRYTVLPHGFHTFLMGGEAKSNLRPTFSGVSWDTPLSQKPCSLAQSQDSAETDAPYFWAFSGSISHRHVQAVKLLETQPVLTYSVALRGAGIKLHSPHPGLPGATQGGVMYVGLPFGSSYRMMLNIHVLYSLSLD